MSYFHSPKQYHGVLPGTHTKIKECKASGSHNSVDKNMGCQLLIIYSGHGLTSHNTWYLPTYFVSPCVIDRTKSYPPSLNLPIQSRFEVNSCYPFPQPPPDWTKLRNFQSCLVRTWQLVTFGDKGRQLTTWRRHNGKCYLGGQSELRALWSLLRANFTQNKHQVLLQLLWDTYDWWGRNLETLAFS